MIDRDENLARLVLVSRDVRHARANLEDWLSNRGEILRQLRDDYEPPVSWSTLAESAGVTTGAVREAVAKARTDRDAS